MTMKKRCSKCKGVIWYKRDKKWRVCIKDRGKIINLGQYDDEIKAAEVYDKKAKELFGEFASLNFPTPEQPPASDFTKPIRLAMTDFLNIYGKESEIFPPIDAKSVLDLCDRLDQQASQLKAKDELLFAYESVKAPKQPPAGEFFPLTRKDMYEIIQGCCGLCPWCVGVLGRYVRQESDRLDASEASRKELLTACRQAFNKSHNPKVEKILKVAIEKG